MDYLVDDGSMSNPPILVEPTVFTRILGEKEYEMKDHLGNVRVVISDLKAAPSGGAGPWAADILSWNNYYPFGMVQPDRHGNTEGYRYGFNGMEMDNEVRENPTTGTVGTGNSYTTHFRQYDPRSGRWWSVDPLASKYPQWSPYPAFTNNPIMYVDQDGREPRWGQLANLDRLLGDMWKAFNAKNVITATISAKLAAMSDYFAADRKFKRVNGKLVDVDPSKNIGRYIYTKKSGWIDMHHFFRLADYTRENGQKIAELYAYNSERWQSFRGSPSGWSYEDIASNIAGIEFWLNYGEKLKEGEITLTDAVKEYLTTLEAVDPSEAPNYEYIPHTVKDGYVLKSSNKRGLKGDDLKNRHKEIYNSRPDKDLIKNAHETIENNSDED